MCCYVPEGFSAQSKPFYSRIYLWPLNRVVSERPMISSCIPFDKLSMVGGTARICNSASMHYQRTVGVVLRGKDCQAKTNNALGNAAACPHPRGAPSISVTVLLYAIQKCSMWDVILIKVSARTHNFETEFILLLQTSPKVAFGSLLSAIGGVMNEITRVVAFTSKFRCITE